MNQTICKTCGCVIGGLPADINLHVQWHASLLPGAATITEQPDEPEVPTVVLEMAKAIHAVGDCRCSVPGCIATGNDSARAALRVVVRTLAFTGNGMVALRWKAIADGLGMTQAQLDGLMAEGGQG